MKSGFTLIELLAVMVVIGILAALGLPAWHSIADKFVYNEEVETASVECSDVLHVQIEE